MQATELRRTLRQVRLERGWTYDQLADAINATRRSAHPNAPAAVSSMTVWRFLEGRQRTLRATTRFALERFAATVSAAEVVS